MSRLVSALLVLILFLAALVACQNVAPPAATPTPTVAPRPAPTSTPDDGRIALVVDVAGGSSVIVRVEVAATPEQRALGLMHRDVLPEGEGMLFVFPSTTTTGFWMKNTKVPLSIAFIDGDGTIVGLDDMDPLTEAVHSPPQSYRYALEVPQGFFARQGVQPGDEIICQSGSERQPLSQVDWSAS